MAEPALPLGAGQPDLAAVGAAWADAVAFLRLGPVVRVGRDRVDERDTTFWDVTVGRLVSYCLGAGGAADDDDDDDAARSRGGDDDEAPPRQRRRIEVLAEPAEDDNEAASGRSFAGLRPMARLAAERLATALDLAAQLRAMTADRNRLLAQLRCAGAGGGVPREPRPAPWADRIGSSSGAVMTAAAVEFLMTLRPAPPRDAPETAALVPAIVDLFERLLRPTTLPANPGAVHTVSQAVVAGMGMAVAPLLVSSALPSGAQGRPHSPDVHVEASLLFRPVRRCFFFFLTSPIFP